MTALQIDRSLMSLVYPLTVQIQPVRKRLVPAGLMLLAVTSIGCGFNWPVTSSSANSQR